MSNVDSFPLNGIDHVHFLVGNAKQAAHYYRTAFGFSLTAYRGPENGSRDIVSYVLEQSRVRFVVSAPLRPDNPMYDFVRLHGDGVRDIALDVDDAFAAWQKAVERGAESAYEPKWLEDEHGRIAMAGIKTYGDTIHSFVSRREYRGAFRPGYVAVALPDAVARPVGLCHIDHMVGNVGWNQMLTWVDWYSRVMGFSIFQSFDDKDISTEYSALMSKVMANGNGRIKFPINEPAEGKKKSQIEEYIDFYHGPGVQHIALSTGNILETVDRLAGQGVEFLRVPSDYYEQLEARVGKIEAAVRVVALGHLGGSG